MQHRQSGLTIIELVAVLGVFSIALIGVASGFIYSAHSVQDTRQRNLVRQATRNVVETLRSASFAGLTAEFGVNSGSDVFWCNADGVVSFSDTDPGGSIVKGSIVFFDDMSTTPEIFSNLPQLFGAEDPGFLYASLGVLPTRLTLEFAGGQTETIDLLLRRNTTEEEDMSLSDVVDFFVGLADELSNSGPQNARDMAEDIVAALQTALSETAKSPPDNAAAAGVITSALADIQAMINSGDLDAAMGESLIATLTAIASQGLAGGGW